jgi:hypothetical protein
MHIPRLHWKKKGEKVVIKTPDMSMYATKEDIANIIRRLDTAEKRRVWNNLSPRLKIKLANRIVAKRGVDGADRKKS